ncbi:MAG: ATP-binding protein [Bacteroidota bacterium]
MRPWWIILVLALSTILFPYWEMGAQDTTVDSLSRVERSDFEALFSEKELIKEAFMEKKLASQRRVLIIGIFGFGALLIFSIFISNRLLRTQKQKETIQLQKLQIEQSEKFKDQFLANMSHEIRTPMHAISGMLEILRRNEHTDFQQPIFEAMHSSAENLLIILNDILDLSKIEVGKLHVVTDPMSPREVMEDVYTILKVKADAKGLQFEYQIDEQVPAIMIGDPVRLNQVLTNLVDNAIKFTDQGLVMVSISNTGQHIRYRIQDSGMGIPKDKMDLIFAAFVQADHSVSKTHAGTGLGLSISKQLVHLMDGRIWAESSPGKGSSFYVELPLRLPTQGQQKPQRISDELFKEYAQSLEGLHVLLVEDNEFNQMIATDDLTYLIPDCRVEVAQNGKIAIEKVQAARPMYDLVLMDIQMPELDGFETTKAIRRLDRKSQPPIIALTASILHNDVQKCYDAGMQHYIPKPYHQKDLIKTIYETLKPNSKL